LLFGNRGFWEKDATGNVPWSKWYEISASTSSVVNEVVPGAASHALIAVFEGARNVKLFAVDSNLEIAGEESINELSIERSL
jgi:hypothetical protein